MTVSPNSTALLPTRTRINPADPEGAEYFEAGDVLYVTRNSKGSVRVAKSAGHCEDIVLGSRIDAHHDQTRANFGELEIIGIRFSSGDSVGELPNKRLALRVFK